MDKDQLKIRGNKVFWLSEDSLNIPLIGSDITLRPNDTDAPLFAWMTPS